MGQLIYWPLDCVPFQEHANFEVGAIMRSRWRDEEYSVVPRFLSASLVLVWPIGAVQHYLG